MPESPLAQLEIEIERAAELISRLAHERDALRQQVESLEARLERHDSRRRHNGEQAARLELLERERQAVKTRLTTLLAQLEPAIDGE